MAVFLHLVVVDEVGEFLLATPQVDEFGDEVDARLHGVHEARLERNGQTLALAAELGALGLAVVAHPLLAEVLHVVHVESHHVAQAVRIEQGVGTFADSIFGIALHQTQLLQAFHHDTGREVVDVHIGNAGSQGLDALQMHGVLNLVDGALAGSEGLVGGDGGRHVAAIARRQFGTGVNEEEVARLDFVTMIVVVQRLPVNGGDGGEGEFAIVTLGHVVHLGHHLVFVHAGTDALHGGDVHVGRYVASLLDFFDFLGRLVVALRHHGTDKGYRPLLACGRQAQPVHQLQLVLGAVGRQVMDALTALHGLVQVADDIGRGACVGDAHGCGFLAERGLRTHPDDVVDAQFVAENDFTVFVDVDDGRQPGEGKSEIIKESRILTIAEGVVLVVQSLFVVPQEQQDTRAHGFLQLGSALYISFFRKHGVSCFKG